MAGGIRYYVSTGDLTAAPMDMLVLPRDSRQQVLPFKQCAILDGGAVAPREHAVGRVVLVQPGEHLGGAGGVAPVAHQVADDVEEGDDVDAGLLELCVCDVADL